MTRNADEVQTRQALNVLAAIAIAFFVTIALYWARAVLIPLALAILITFVLSPVVLVLQRRGLGRVPSVFIVLAVSLIVIATVGLVVGSQVVQLTQTLPDHADRIKGKIQTLKSWLSSDHSNRFGKLVNDVTAIFDSSSNQPPAPGAAGGREHFATVGEPSSDLFESGRGRPRPISIHSDPCDFHAATTGGFA